MNNDNIRSETQRRSTLRQAVGWALVLSSMISTPVLSAQTDISSSPITSTNGVQAKPNIMLLVDTSGYSTAVQEKYQGYLLTEVPLVIGDHTLPPGAYGIGFVGDHFGVMDIGNHDLLQAPATRDDQMKRPLPLQILDGASSGSWKLCFGRTCVDFRRQ